MGKFESFLALTTSGNSPLHTLLNISDVLTLVEQLDEAKGRGSH